jgi:hypothetical protein
MPKRNSDGTFHCTVSRVRLSWLPASSSTNGIPAHAVTILPSKSCMYDGTMMTESGDSTKICDSDADLPLQALMLLLLLSMPLLHVSAITVTVFFVTGYFFQE